MIGGATAELLFNATCSSNSDCTGSLWLSAFADFAVTPAAVWGLGTAMSGEGKLSTTYYGLVIGVVPFAVQGSPNDSPQTTISRIQTELAISVALTPFATALAYEVSSTVQAVAWFRAHNARMAFAPSRGGGFATVGLSF